jgi:hypothetical protein
MTPALTLLRDKLDVLADLVESLELELVDDPKWPEPSDMSYLTAKERKDPDIMSNVDAMLATNELISWFGRDMEGFLGLWRGPKNTPLEQAPIVRLDSEGQYDLVAASIGDYLAISTDADEFDAQREAIVAAGFPVGRTPEAIWEALAGFEDPNDFRHVLYNEGRKRRGLEAIED